MLRYAVIYGRDGFENGRRALLYGHVEAVVGKLEEAKLARKCCGDLVFNVETREVVQNGAWLFDAERQPELDQEKGFPYATAAIRDGIRLSSQFWDTTTKRFF